MSQPLTRFLRRLLVLALVVIILANFDHVSTRARDASVKFSGAAVESKFRKSITFKIKAESAGSRIVGARVMVHDIADSTSQIHRAEAFDPANSVDFTAIWDTASDIIPPWKLLRYQ